MFYQLTAAKINDLSELTFTEREMSEPGLAYRQAGLGGLIGLGDFEPQNPVQLLNFIYSVVK